MAVVFTCDRCGSGDVQGNLTISIDVRKERGVSSNSPLHMGDVCFSCQSKLRGLIEAWAKDRPKETFEEYLKRVSKEYPFPSVLDQIKVDGH